MKLTLTKDHLSHTLRKYIRYSCVKAWRYVGKRALLVCLSSFSPVLLLGVAQLAHATDLLAAGKDDVKATFAADSFVIMCVYIAEIVVGVAGYIRTKNLLILLGLVVVIVFTTVGLSFVN